MNNVRPDCYSEQEARNCNAREHLNETVVDERQYDEEKAQQDHSARPWFTPHDYITHS